MDRINVRLDPHLKEQLDLAARAEGVSPSEVVRAALREHLKAKAPQPDCFDLARKLGILGLAKGLPTDLSTNPIHMEGFGE
ncbi:CopG family transcriptional regulator [Isosphaeraceae bacterium EP7]